MSVFRCQMRDFLVDLFTDARSYSSMLQMRFSRKAWLVHHSLHHCCGQRWLRTKANSSLQCLTCPAVPLYHPHHYEPDLLSNMFSSFFFQNDFQLGYLNLGWLGCWVGVWRWSLVRPILQCRRHYIVLKLWTIYSASVHWTLAEYIVQLWWETYSSWAARWNWVLGVWGGQLCTRSRCNWARIRISAISAFSQHALLWLRRTTNHARF